MLGYLVQYDKNSSQSCVVNLDAENLKNGMMLVSVNDFTKELIKDESINCIKFNLIVNIDQFVDMIKKNKILLLEDI